MCGSLSGTVVVVYVCNVIDYVESYSIMSNFPQHTVTGKYRPSSYNVVDPLITHPTHWRRPTHTKIWYSLKMPYSKEDACWLGLSHLVVGGGQQDALLINQSPYSLFKLPTDRHQLLVTWSFPTIKLTIRKTTPTTTHTHIFISHSFSWLSTK